MPKMTNIEKDIRARLFEAEKILLVREEDERKATVAVAVARSAVNTLRLLLEGYDKEGGSC